MALKNIFTKLNKDPERIELGEIEDLIQKKKQEADSLWNIVNGYSANARDIVSAIERAEQDYKKANDSFESFKDFEKQYNKELDKADDYYNMIRSKGFGALNEYVELHDELKRFGIQVADYKTQSKEMLKADAVYKQIPSKFKKIK